jgi:hypothetical protein
LGDPVSFLDQLKYCKLPNYKNPQTLVNARRQITSLNTWVCVGARLDQITHEIDTKHLVVFFCIVLFVLSTLLHLFFWVLGVFLGFRRFCTCFWSNGNRTSILEQGRRDLCSV